MPNARESDQEQRDENRGTQGEFYCHAIHRIVIHQRLLQDENLKQVQHEELENWKTEELVEELGELLQDVNKIKHVVNELQMECKGT